MKHPLVFVLLILNTIDAILTHTFITVGLIEELNPVMDYLLQRGWWHFLLFKLFAVNMLILALGAQEVHSDHPKAFRFILVVYFVALLLHLKYISEIIIECLS